MKSNYLRICSWGTDGFLLPLQHSLCSHHAYSLPDRYGKYLGCGKVGSNRVTAGTTICECVGAIPAEERKARVMVIDSDLGGSTAMTKVNS